MIIIELRDSTALSNRLTWLPHNKEGFRVMSFVYLSTATISNVWCLEICAGTLFVILLKFGAVLSVIYGFLMAFFFLDPFTALYCCRAVVSEDAKSMLASGLQNVSFEGGSYSVSRCVRTWIKLTLEYHFKYIFWSLPFYFTSSFLPSTRVSLPVFAVTVLALLSWTLFVCQPKQTAIIWQGDGPKFIKCHMWTVCQQALFWKCYWMLHIMYLTAELFTSKNWCWRER